MKRTICFFLLIVATRVHCIDFDDEDRDLRLRLDDISQVSRTTSLNWTDIAVAQATLSTAVIDPPSQPADAAVVKRPVAKKLKIFIDPGHGGKDEGAGGIYGVSEKTVCLRIAHFVKTNLEKWAKRRKVALEVQLSREKDAFLTLHRRVRIANEWGADLFVSIHANSSNYATAKGFEVYFMSPDATDAHAIALAKTENAGVTSHLVTPDVQSMLSDAQSSLLVTESSRFAETVFQTMSRRLHASGRGVRQAPFAVLAGTDMPALLIEVGYLTHEDEAEQLTKVPYLKRLSNAISSGIIEFAVNFKKLG